MIAAELETSRPDSSSPMAALSYEAPYLIEKLLKEQIVETPDEGQALFAEVLRYLVLDQLYPDRRWQMYSRRIDEVWHQFILFTREYTSFCDRYFGALLHHFPSNAPGMDKEALSREEDIQAFREFRGHYERVFGVALSSLWYDRRSVTLNRRVLLDVTIGPLALEESAGQVTLKGEKGRAFTVNSLARPALELILQTRSFYVRELPGGLSDEEKLGLVETLVAMHVLMLAP